MRDLAAPEDKPVFWTFRTKPEIEQTRTEQGPLTWTVTSVYRYRETTVRERLFIDARKWAAQILGVEPCELKQVTK